MSNKMAAIIGAILEQDWTQPAIIELCITSDGYLLARENGDCGFNQFLGTENELRANWDCLLSVAELTDAERKLADLLYIAALKPVVSAGFASLN